MEFQEHFDPLNILSANCHFPSYQHILVRLGARNTLVKAAVISIPVLDSQHIRNIKVEQGISQQ